MLDNKDHRLKACAAGIVKGIIHDHLTVRPVSYTHLDVYKRQQADGDVRALTKALNAALNGRGGGKPGICQGSCAAAPEQVEEFLREQNR